MTRAILITGSRDWTDRARIRRVLANEASRPGAIVIHGAAGGADTIADEEARALGMVVERYPADWKRHRKAGGPIRNGVMLARLLALRDEGASVAVYAFPLPGSVGTHDMIERARRAGVDVEVVT